jgi:hypothetical protein
LETSLASWKSTSSTVEELRRQINKMGMYENILDNNLHSVLAPQSLDYRESLAQKEGSNVPVRPSNSVEIHYK